MSRRVKENGLDRNSFRSAAARWRARPRQRAAAMSAGTYKRKIFKVATAACAATVLGAGYALDSTSLFLNGTTSSEGSEAVIVADQRSAFLAYVRRRKMQTDPQIKRVSVGDTLPDWGVRYYEIPLRYGAPFYRCVVIGEEVVIADPSTGRVIQVVVD
jgi:Protein of unknown function (DUF1236)